MRRYTLIIVLCTAFIFFILVSRISAQKQIFLILEKESAVRGDKISLGDLCIIIGASEKKKKQLYALPIAQSPRTGDTRKIKKNYIRMRLQQNRIDLSDIRFTGSPVVTVTRCSQRISRTMLKQKVEEYLSAYASKQKVILTIEELNIHSPDEFFMPVGQMELKFNMPSSHLKPSCGFYVLCFIDGKKEQSFWVKARLALEKEVLVAKNTIDRFQVITGNDIEKRKIKLSDSTYESFYTDENLVIGKRARTTIPAQTVVHARQLEIAPLVTKGDRVRIVLENDKLKIVSIGEAQENGYAGELLRVQNISSEKEVVGMLKDENTVIIQY
ncbi:MAG: flagellar basal body P-ring formation chaperone FlgA [bacterium]